MGFFDKVIKTAVDVSTGGFTNDDAKSLIPGIGDAMAQEKANKQNIALDKANKEWMERMSSTAYQRGMEDMKKAGLNPMLAFQQGGASAPSSASPTVGAASKTALLDAGMKAFTGFSSTRTAQQQANTAQAQAESSIALQSAQAAKEVANIQNTQADTELKKRELRGKGVKDTLDREGGKIIQNIFDKLKTSAKEPGTTKAKTIKFLGIADKKDAPLIKKPN